ncbi:Gfo/Idh/MocA family protein [Novipirellula artificiosorum]|uniref:Putative oxidoreductase YvaA n=1 Tax=Novipirellula artificiosorum TaxID=2528016 RepID=A0A5C6DMU3_9BACT|nr:Gfo/Idh/MocA family oxidoreductase [Novipirellula artificiosorum]TWU36179.1 putative oxidoreductase YvaA [Novipirellula artificiosorum]
MNDPNRMPSASSRRTFIRNTSLGLATAAALSDVPQVHAAGGDDEIKIGLIGCGGRGTGAVIDAVGAAAKVIYPDKGYHTEDVADGAKAANKRIRVVALADMFGDRLERCQTQMGKLGFEIAPDHCFTGFDAYKQLLAVADVNYVILATPPHFRPLHLQAAIEAGKHVFMEKPAAVDAPGVRMVMAAGELAKEKGLGIAAGTQRRHDRSYRDTIARIHEGAIGDIVYGKCYWNGGQIWVINRQQGWSDMEWQLRNWNYFTWLSGDHIVEQHVHNLDIMNWVLGSHPIRAVSGLGGRQVRTGDEHGHIFDHFAVEFEYPNGVSMFSQSRQINGCKNMVEEQVVGSKGKSNCKNWIGPNTGDDWNRSERSPNAYQLEHADLIQSIREGNPINEAQAVAESTMTGIIGREACYSGQAVDWDTAMKSETHLGPVQYTLGKLQIPPVAMPGKYRFS